MQYMSTTELRTKSSLLVHTLKKGGSVSLIHRSKIIGEIKPPMFMQQAQPATAETLSAFLKTVKPTKLIPRAKRAQVYRKHLVEKYGENIS